MRSEYRVYLAVDGSDVAFCGQYPKIMDGMEAAWEARKAKKSGLAKSEWETARKAGHVAGMVAPDAYGEEEDEAIAWIGDYCVVRVNYYGGR